MGEIIGYNAVDPQTLSESQITDFSAANIAKLASLGMRFYAFDAEGNKWQTDTVTPPEPTRKEITLPIITYQLWQEVMNPLRNLMAETMQPATALMPMTIRSNINNDYDNFIAALDKIDDIFANMDE